MPILNEFLQNYSWVIAIAVGVVCLVAVFLLVFSIVRKKRKQIAQIKAGETKNEYLLALGGPDNILSKELKGSRIVLELADYEAVDREKLKEAGVSGFIMMSSKLTLVISGNAKEVYELLFNA